MPKIWDKANKRLIQSDLLAGNVKNGAEANKFMLLRSFLHYFFISLQPHSDKL